MDREFLIRAVCLYWPLLAAAVAWGVIRPGYYARVGLLMAVCWNLAVLPFVNRWAQGMGWWEFGTGGPAVLGMPLELYLGWAAWWGVAMPLVGWSLVKENQMIVLAGVTVVAALLDAVAMPMLDPVLVLHDDWWIGEAALLAVALVPGLLALWWTDRRTCLPGRVLLQGGAFGLLLLGVIPCVADNGSDWLKVGLLQPWWLSGIMGGLTVGFGALGIAGAREFVVAGRGTPLPFDPPDRLVTTGAYRWVANPMQVAMVGLCLVWSVWFEMPWMLGMAVLGVVYSEGLARWSEREDHLERFGEEWEAYRRRVRRWWPGSGLRTGD